MRFLFFLMAFPIMMMSFFEVSDVVPLAQATLLVDGVAIELNESQQESLNENVCSLFEGTRTMPCYCVALHDEFVQSVQSGTFVCLNFATSLEVNGLPFDQLVFELDCEAEVVNLTRGNHGIFQGRCLCVNLDGKTMQDLCDFVDSLDLTETAPDEENDVDEENEAGEENEVEDGNEIGEENEQASDEQESAAEEEENLIGADA